MKKLIVSFCNFANVSNKFHKFYQRKQEIALKTDRKTEKNCWQYYCLEMHEFCLADSFQSSYKCLRIMSREGLAVLKIWIWRDFVKMVKTTRKHQQISFGVVFIRLLHQSVCLMFSVLCNKEISDKLWKLELAYYNSEQCKGIVFRILIRLLHCRTKEL